jgi:hypothetical protein
VSGRLWVDRENKVAVDLAKVVKLNVFVNPGPADVYWVTVLAHFENAGSLTVDERQLKGKYEDCAPLVDATFDEWVERIRKAKAQDASRP